MAKPQADSYDWASAILAVLEAKSGDLNELANAAKLDPFVGDMSDMDCSDLDLSGQNLSGWDLSNARFANARLSQTELRGARLNPAEIVEAIDWEKAKLDDDVRVAAQEAAARRMGVLDQKVADVEFSARTWQILRTAEIMHVGDLVRRSEAEIIRLPNCGRKSLNEMKEMLARFGLRFGMELDSWVPPHRRDVRRA
jgi:hypothetical protein